MFGAVGAALALVGGALLVVSSLATLAVAHHLGRRVAGPAAGVRWVQAAADVGLSLGVLVGCTGALMYRFGTTT